jgi:hypothetical protein
LGGSTDVTMYNCVASMCMYFFQEIPAHTYNCMCHYPSVYLMKIPAHTCGQILELDNLQWSSMAVGMRRYFLSIWLHKHAEQVSIFIYCQSMRGAALRKRPTRITRPSSGPGQAPDQAPSRAGAGTGAGACELSSISISVLTFPVC